MLAVWLEQQALSLREIPAPVRDTPQGAGEALVRVRLAGVCHTDIELTRGYYPYAGVLGHEFVGVVASAGLWHGRRVVGEINAVCGECAACRHGRRSHCERRTVLGIINRDGAFAEYLRLPLENLHAVPEDLSDEEAVFTEPLAAALEILQQVHVRPEDTVVVVGDGKLGLLCAQVLALTGCRLTVLGRHADKLALLEQRGIAIALADAAPALAADIVVEATGRPAGFELARRLVRPRGTLVLKSTYAGRLTVDMSRLVVDEITLVGSRCGPFPAALAALAGRRVDVRGLIQARYPLAAALTALEHAQQPGVLKVLIEMPR
ncbi:MAG: alcohol dehydrogenase catalytic domain-containing protein [Anaerolineales bacterium]|nr:alcohol dehydrogenase catalytic domain-containing protein [Anaerolineales bacterium]